jgi:hypothetical protein
MGVFLFSLVSGEKTDDHDHEEDDENESESDMRLNEYRGLPVYPG